MYDVIISYFLFYFRTKYVNKLQTQQHVYKFCKVKIERLYSTKSFSQFLIKLSQGNRIKRRPISTNQAEQNSFTGWTNVKLCKSNQLTFALEEFSRHTAWSFHFMDHVCTYSLSVAWKNTKVWGNRTIALKSRFLQKLLKNLYIAWEVKLPEQ